MFGVYLQEVTHGDNLTGRDDISDDTIRLYLSAANTYFRRFRYNMLTPVFTGQRFGAIGQIGPILGGNPSITSDLEMPCAKKGSH
jgi:hypothetical protein